MPLRKVWDAAMNKKIRARRYVVAVAALTMLSVPFFMTVHRSPPEAPVAHRDSAQPVAPVALAPAPLQAAAQPPASAVQVGERSPYIVQAATADIARSAVLKVGGVVTGDLSIIRAVGASLG